MIIFTCILAVIFAIMTFGEKNEGYKKIYAACYSSSLLGAILFSLFEIIIRMG